LGLSAFRGKYASAMPLRWKIAPLEHMVVCVFEGTVTAQDVAAYFAALEAAGASRYRRIIDISRGECTLSDDEVSRLGVRTGSADRSMPPGAMAIVTGSSRNDRTVTNLRRMNPPGRQMRAFRTIHEARRWLGGLPQPSGPRKGRA
jgi:hypothetical protein